jgi:plastocyanin
MTSALHICFSALVLLGLAASATRATTVRGSVELVASRDPMVRRHKDYSGVVVWLEPLANPVSPAVPSRPAQMIQKNKMFTPHVLAVPLSGSVSFPNLDPIFHNAFSNFNGQIFDVGLYKPGSSRTVVFKRAGIVRVFCNIHPQMSAVIAVLDTPYFAVSNKAGAFEIANIPPGADQHHVFHGRAHEEPGSPVRRAGGPLPKPLELPPLPISESGYLQVPHKNKYGKEYPPVIDNQPAYPGAKR